MPWFYDSYSGKLVHEDPPSPGFYTYEAALHTGTGWHELNVPDTATQAQAQAAADALHAGAPAQQPNASIGDLAKNLPAQGARKAASVAADALGNAFSLNANASFLARLAEGLIGAALIIAGAAHLFNIKLPSVVPV